MTDIRRFRRLPVLILLAAGLAAGSACAGSDHQAEKAGDGKKTNPEDAMLAFARCMREHGVDMPDPDTSGGHGGVMTFSASASAGDADSDAGLDPGADGFQAANEACKDLLGDMGPQNMSPEQSKEMQDQALAFSRCMREHGVNMPDPNFDGEGHVMMKIDDSTGVDPSDPDFEAAQQACGSAFGPAGAKGGAGFSVGGGTVDGAKGGGKSGMVVIGGGIPAGGAK
jgi:hypothetical protein